MCLWNVNMYFFERWIKTVNKDYSKLFRFCLTHEVKMKIKAPPGYHWMKQKDGTHKFMKHKGEFVPHKGASLFANFPVQKKHTTNGPKKRS